jgi:hypothetical protein
MLDISSGGRAVDIGYAIIATLFAMPPAALITYGILAVMCLLLQSCFSRIPPEHRQMEPRRVWFLLVPCLNIVWNFVVCIRLARSFKSHFRAQGVREPGDCGHALSLAYCITGCAFTLLVWIPPSGYLIQIATGILQLNFADAYGPLRLATVGLLLVNTINPVPVTNVMFTILWNFGFGLLALFGILALLVLTLAKFITLRNRIQKPA